MALPQLLQVISVAIVVRLCESTEECCNGLESQPMAPSCVSYTVAVESQAVQYGKTVEPSACLLLRLWRRERVGSLLVMSLRKNKRRYCAQEEVFMGRKEPTKERGSADAE